MTVCFWHSGEYQVEGGKHSRQTTWGEMEADCVSECDESLDISVEDEEEEEDGSQGEEFNNRYCSSKKIKIISARLRSFGKRDKEKEFYANALSLSGNKV